jgi:hypothetical protein
MENREFSREELIEIGNILCKENIFNITNLDEVKDYENIRKEVCDTIIQNPNSESLNKYPKIAAMSTLDREKTAVLQKIYGQSLEDAKYLLNLYGEDIDRLQITSENEDIIAYMKSLKVIMNADENLLKSVYEECEETIDINSVYDVEFIEEKMKDVYLETYNEKIYKTKEEDLVGTEYLDGHKIDVYDAGTEFSMSITSIGAFISNNERTEYKKDWNRPKTASQGYCTSYIRNDMLATAGINNVVYGFDGYDKGSLMMSGYSDIGSNAKCFRPDSSIDSVFLTEDTQINSSTGYNEMVFSRYNENGERRQPSYIVYMKKGENLERRNLGK